MYATQRRLRDRGNCSSSLMQLIVALRRSRKNDNALGIVIVFGIALRASIRNTKAVSVCRICLLTFSVPSSSVALLVPLLNDNLFLKFKLKIIAFLSVQESHRIINLSNCCQVLNV